MKFIRTWTAAAVAAVVLAACGGAGDGDQTARVKYGKMVTFGDSLSDVGSYATAGIKAIGGGKFTVNGTGVKIWIEDLAAQAGVAAPCAAQVGLESSGPLASFAQAPATVSGCYDYAQGGSRVTNPVGPGNKALIPSGDTSGYLGQLTVPVVTQINRHLTISGGAFAADDLVTVLAGGNDVFINLATLSAQIAGGVNPTVAATAAVTAMGTAGAQLAGYVNTLMIAKGAKTVVVVNLPDVSKTPLAYARDAATQALILQMSAAFNTQLAAGLSGVSGVLLVDAFTQSQDQAAHPDQYSLTNATATACDPAKATIGSLGCSAATTVSGDVSRYAYADPVHPTPYGYQLLARFVAQAMLKAGLL